MILSPSCRSRKVCQISSVINGINGCSNCNSCSKIFSVSSYVFRSIGWPYAGLIISSNQDENSSRKVVYTVISASEIRYWSNWVFNVSFTFPNRCLSHSNAKREWAGWSMEATSQDFTSLKAFHILVVKLRPCSGRLSSNSKSPPAGAHNNIPTRTPSAPYLSIKSNGSGEFPKDLDILRPSLSRTIPVKYTFLNGIFPSYS